MEEAPQGVGYNTKPDRAWQYRSIWMTLTGTQCDFWGHPVQGQESALVFLVGPFPQDTLWFCDFLRSKIIAVDIENTIAIPASNHHSKLLTPCKFQALKT